MVRMRKLGATKGGAVFTRWLVAATTLLAVLAAGHALWPYGARAAPTGDDELAGSAVTQEESNLTIRWETNNKPVNNPSTPRDESNIPLDEDEHPATPTNGTGNGNKAVRVFPDLKYDDDNLCVEPEAQWAPLRRRVLAVIEFTGEDVPDKAYFRLWDVDDPSANTSDTDVIDNAGAPNAFTNGPDNRDSTGWRFAQELDADKHTVEVKFGKIKRFDGSLEDTGNPKIGKVEVMVGLRPGDNYRFAACLVLDNLLEPKHTQEKADLGQPPPEGKISKVLTVWRYLHVEFDTMQPPPANEPFGLLAGVSSVITADTLTAQGNPNWPVNALEGGVLDPAGPNAPITVNYVGRATWTVIQNAANAVTVQVNYTGDGWDNDNNGQIDDPGEVYNMTPANPSNAPFSVNTDDPPWPGTLAPTPAAALDAINPFFRPVYIKCVQQNKGNVHADFAWCRKQDFNQQAATVDVPGEPLYWTVCVGWCYEAARGLNWERCLQCIGHRYYIDDDDPEDEGVTAGYVSCVLGKAEDMPSDRLMVFLEHLRDYNAPQAKDAAWTLGSAVSHEIGHCLTLRHATYTGTFEAKKDGIMEWDPSAPPPCFKQWQDLKRNRPNRVTDRFSYENMRDLRTNDLDPK